MTLFTVFSRGVKTSLKVELIGVPPLKSLGNTLADPNSCILGRPMRCVG